MGDRLQQRRFQGVALPDDLGGLRFCRQAVLAERLTNLVSGSGEKAGLSPARLVSRSGSHGHN